MLVEFAERLEPQLIAATGEAIILSEIPSIKVNWDRYRVDQVLTNLITNAIRYGEGRPVSLSVQHQDGNILIIVKDQGPGIRPEDRERIFNLFERVDIKNAVRGLGLGLYISKQIVIAHGGRIWVEGQRGQGSIFYVKLPIADFL
jgi:signal transduction histidine kinase